MRSIKFLSVTLIFLAFLRAECSVGLLKCPTLSELKPVELNASELVYLRSYLDILTKSHPIFSNFVVPEINPLTYRTRNNLPGEAGENLIGGLFCSGYQNPKKMTLVLHPTTTIESVSFRTTIIHEWVHFNFWLLRLDAPLWFEEGLALVAQSIYAPDTVTGLERIHLIYSPGVPLSYTSDDLNNLSNNQVLSFYGGSFLFVRYLAKNFGEFALTRLMVNSKDDWISRMCRLVTSNEPCELRMNELFQNYTIARLFNSLDYFGEPKDLYRYFVSDEVGPRELPTWKAQKHRTTHKWDKGLSFQLLDSSDNSIGALASDEAEIFVWQSPSGEVAWSRDRLPSYVVHKKVLLKF